MEIIVKSCLKCPFYDHEYDECVHPTPVKYPTFDSPPKDCPLRKESATIKLEQNEE